MTTRLIDLPAIGSRGWYRALWGRLSPAPAPAAAAVPVDMSPPAIQRRLEATAAQHVVAAGTIVASDRTPIADPAAAAEARATVERAAGRAAAQLLVVGTAQDGENSDDPEVQKVIDAERRTGRDAARQLFGLPSSEGA